MWQVLPNINEFSLQQGEGDSLCPKGRVGPASSIALTGEKGFTLIEIVMVIVVLGILGVAGADFIGTAFKGFSQADARMDLYEEGKMALVRMERELRNVVPYAINPPPALPADPVLEFGMVDETAMQNVFGRYTETAGDFPTNKLNDENGASASPEIGWILAVYNTKWDPDFTDGDRLFRVADVKINKEMRFNPKIIEPSPKQRYYVVDKAVRYYKSGTTLYRSEDDTVSDSNPAVDLDGATGYPLTTHVDTLTFQYAPGTLTRNGLIVINMTLKKDDEHVKFHKEVHIRNVP